MLKKVWGDDQKRPLAEEVTSQQVKSLRKPSKDGICLEMTPS